MRNHPILFALTFAAAAGCGPTTYEQTGTDLTRGTDAEISVHDDDAGNHVLSVRVDHLPPPSRVASGTNHYVVWSVPRGGVPQHVGGLEYDEDSRVGELETVTPYDEFEVRITAERERLPRSPSEHVVVKQNVHHGDD
jgi:hypothetical protein